MGGKVPPRLESELTLESYPDRPEAEGSAGPAASVGEVGGEAPVASGGAGAGVVPGVAGAVGASGSVQAPDAAGDQGGTRQSLAVRLALVRPQERGESHRTPIPSVRRTIRKRKLPYPVVPRPATSWQHWGM